MVVTPVVFKIPDRRDALSHRGLAWRTKRKNVKIVDKGLVFHFIFEAACYMKYVSVRKAEEFDQ